MERPQTAIFVSDIHFTDRAGGDPITPTEWADFIADVVDKESEHAPVELVLLGDIVDVLRSDLWHERDLRPWNNVGQQFRSFSTTAQAGLLLEILDRIGARYQEGLEHLARLVSEGRVVSYYIPGNHDYAATAAPALRKKLAELFSTGAGDAELSELYIHPELSVVARHGHQVDPFNSFDRENTRWAIGDAVVIELVNGLSWAYRQRTRQPEGHHTVQALDRLDNVAAIQLIPEYLRSLMRYEIEDADHALIQELWAGRIDAFVAAVEGKKNLWSLDHANQLVGLLKGVRDLRAASLLGRLADIASGVSPSLPSELRSTAAMVRGHNQGQPVRFAVMGHTHQPGCWPLGALDYGALTRFYLNTGTWRQVVQPIGPPRRDDFRQFVAHRLTAYLVIRGGAPPTFDHVVRCRG